jgi:hypothetical protein
LGLRLKNFPGESSELPPSAKDEWQHASRKNAQHRSVLGGLR